MTLSNPEIERLLKDYEKNIAELKTVVAQICWYMRGGVNYSQLMEMSNRDFKYFNSVVEDNIELSKKNNTIIL